jgi:sensor histidine kinase YesM
MRIKTPEDIRFEAEGDLNVMISPALFVPLIENAFKFGSFRNRKPCVDIKLKSENGIVTLKISNYYETRTDVANTGHSGYGITNLKKRLDLTYPGKHQLIIDQGDLLYKVQLTIDTNAN